ncbi:MAG: hypothetical protein EHM37_11165 [Deltaproteobacteria bacterium]|nr:MAG: hypothetical protein EHM37_11165 [Deltaproteobacteria bacterium]
MNELEIIKSLWPKMGIDGKIIKKNRETSLIVPEITYFGQDGSLNNDSWAFKVGYAFRDALDIKYEERKINKEPYMVWTQGPHLNFKEGDMLHAKDGNRAVQVLSAKQMKWDSAKEEIYQGLVVYLEYVMSGDSLSKLKEHECTQMQFLQLLIDGQYDGSSVVKS